jgi:TonB family protein
MLRVHRGEGTSLIGVIVLCLCLSASNANAEDAKALAARLHATAAASSIDAVGLLPWHLKMDVQLFDAKGTPTDKGTVEEWWASPEIRRVTFTMPSYTVTHLHNKDGYFQTRGDAYESPILDELLGQVVHPMPHESEIDSAKPDLRKKNLGTVVLDCIMLDQPLSAVSSPPLGLFPTYCLDPGKETLRITAELGSLMFVRNTTGLFQGRSVAVVLTGNSDDVEVVSGHVTVLANLQIADADFAPAADMDTLPPAPAKVASGTMAAQLLSQPDPVYPEIAKQNHISGTVVLRAIIGRDGRVRTLHIVSTPDSNLAIASIAAVRKWVYKPFLLNGVPTEVSTTIPVIFSFGGR